MKWTTQKRKINDLLPYSNNPRQMTEKQNKDLESSLKKFDLVEIPAINTDGTILAGHQRLRIMQALGRGNEEIDVRVPDRQLTEKEIKEYNIRSNKNTGEWDWDILANNFEIDDLLEWGFEEKDLRIEREIEEDEAPEVSDEPAISKYGEVYQLGRHRLMCGDATKIEDVEKLMDGKKADMAFTDPPYNIDYQGGMNTHGQNKREGIFNDKMTTSAFYEFLEDSCRNIVQNTSGAIYICMSSKELPTLKTAFEQAGGHWQSFVIWVKNTFTLSRSDYQNQYEPILYGWREGVVNHYFIGDRTIGNVVYDITNYYNEKKNQTVIKIGDSKIKIEGKVTGTVERSKRKKDIWEYPKPTKSKEHPTMKPLRLVAEAIRNSSPNGGIILDTFGGSGSTLIACEQTSRICYMMELDPKYCDVIRKRYAKFIDKEDTWQEITPAVN